MKFLIYFIISFSFSLSLFAENITTIRLSYIIKNSTEFNIFLERLEIVKSDLFDELKKEERELEKRKSEIEDSKIILNEEEYSKLLENFNNDTNIYMSKINHYENYLNMNIPDTIFVTDFTVGLIPCDGARNVT